MYASSQTAPKRVIAALSVGLLVVVALVAVTHHTAAPAGDKTASATSLAWRTSPTFLHSTGDKTDAECKAAGHISSCGAECCRYCDDIGCCDSDAEGTYCKAQYDAKKKKMEDQVKEASCSTDDDCTDCPASKVAAATGEPTADCAMVKDAGFCAHPMGAAMCPVVCDACPSSTELDIPTTSLKWRTSPTFLHSTGDKTDAECEAAGHISSCGMECCRYCDDIGCCDSDAEGTYCKAQYDAKKKEMEDQVKEASCSTDDDCTDCPASKVAAATGEPTADCAMVKDAGFCAHPMGAAMCPVVCDACP